jgi:ABC-type nickel/cobalt efflux system permease component RcnA
MRHITFAVVLLTMVVAWSQPAWAQNPFTTKPKLKTEAPKPLMKNRLLAKITLWQYQLKQKMSDLIRSSKENGSFAPILSLIGIAFLYGAIHAAGPGHGKVVATTYLLSHRATMMGGILFGVSFAVIHAMSGAIGVIGLKYILDESISETLHSTTVVTQLASYGIIAALGIAIAVKHVAALRGRGAVEKHNNQKTGSKKGIIPWAAAVGIVPCPAVVMVMLFCVSLDAIVLGLLLAACICIGMATTISIIVTIIALGKSGALNTLSQPNMLRVEGALGVVSGIAITMFGSLFLLATINSAYH